MELPTTRENLVRIAQRTPVAQTGRNSGLGDAGTNGEGLGLVSGERWYVPCVGKSRPHGRS